jgi:hypothetical protein
VPEITREWVETRLRTLQEDLEKAFANWATIRGRYEETQGWLNFFDGKAVVDGNPLSDGTGAPVPPSTSTETV